MANKIIKFRTVDCDIFQAVVDGKKKLETRAATPKYRKVKIGDGLILVCGKKKIIKVVRKVEYFKTIGALLKKYKPETINPAIHSIKEIREMWSGFPGYKEKIKKSGLVLWHLK